MNDNYCLIRLTEDLNISLYFFYVKNRFMIYPVCITSNKSEMIYSLMSLHNYFSYLSIGHVAYLGKELYKAELALIFDQEYIQS